MANYKIHFKKHDLLIIRYSLRAQIPPLPPYF